MFREGVRWILALLIALLVMWAVRAWAFTIFSVPDSGYAPVFRKGDRWIVNRLDSTAPKVGDCLVFRKGSGYYPAQVMAVPGDTIRYRGNSYRIPVHACKGCSCGDCQCYLLQVGSRSLLVCRHQFVGKARHLFHLGF